MSGSHCRMAKWLRPKGVPPGSTSGSGGRPESVPFASGQALAESTHQSRPLPSLITSALSTYGVVAIGTLIVLFLTPLIIRRLGKEAYGVWVLVTIIVGYAGLLDLGVSAAVRRFVARHAGTGNTAGMNGALGSAMAVFIIMGLAAASLLLVGTDHVVGWFNTSAEMTRGFQLALRIMALALAFGLPGRVFLAALSAREAFLQVNALHIGRQVLVASLTVVVVLHGLGVAGIAAVTCGVGLLFVLAVYLTCRRMFPEMRFSPLGAARRQLTPMLSYGVFALLLVLADKLRFRVSAVVVGKMIGVKEVAFFNVAAMLCNQCGHLLAIAGLVLVPRLSRLDGHGNEDAIRALFIRGSRTAGLFAVLLFSSVMILGRTILRLWVGPEFHRSFPVILILAPAYCLFRSQAIALSLALAKGRHRLLAVVMVVEGVVNVTLSALLAPVWGIYGVAIGLAAPMAVSAVIVWPWCTARVANLTVRRYYREVLARPWITFVLAALAGLLPGALIGWSTLTVLLSAVVAAAVVLVMMASEVRETMRVAVRWASRARLGSHTQ